MLPFKLVYHDRYDLNLGAHVFPSQKYRLVHDALLAEGFADAFNRHHDGDLLVFGHFMQINMQHLAGQNVVLDFLHQRCQVLEGFGRGDDELQRH